MGMVFNKFLHFPYSWVWLFAKIHSLVTYFDISGFMGMIFREFPHLWVYFCEISLDLWVLLLRFEWKNYLGNSSDPPPTERKTFLN